MYSSHYHFHSHILFLSYNLSVQTKSRNEEIPETFIVDTLRTEAIGIGDYKTVDKIFWRFHHSRKGPNISDIERLKANEVLGKYHSSKDVPNVLDLPRIYLMFCYLQHYYLAVIVNLRKIDPLSEQEHG